MIKATYAAKDKSFRKYLFIIAFICLILGVTSYFSQHLNFKNLSEKFSSNQNKQKIIVADELKQKNEILTQQQFIQPIGSSEEQISDKNLEKIAEEPKQTKENINEYLQKSSVRYSMTDEYLLYLKNVNHIIINFFLDEPYTNYLNRIKTNNLPEALGSLLKDLEEYNKYLISPPNLKKRIFPSNSKILEKFIRIDKNSAELEIKLEKKGRITSKLKFWLDYCYSEDFKMKFNN